jgi:methoxymalonate biosynthesis acyl carrier protein
MTVLLEEGMARAEIKAYIGQNMTKFDDEADFSDSDNIFQLGVVNSLFAMKLLNFIENHLHVTIDDDDVEIANFATIDNMIKLINKKRC